MVLHDSSRSCHCGSARLRRRYAESRAQAPERIRRVAGRQSVEPATVSSLPEVMNRFRLFRDERDFRPPCRGGAGTPCWVQQARRRAKAAGRATWWCGLCLDGVAASPITACATACARAISTADHRVEVRLAGLIPAGATLELCRRGRRGVAFGGRRCRESVAFRARYGKPTIRAPTSRSRAVLRRATGGSRYATS